MYEELNIWIIKRMKDEQTDPKRSYSSWTTMGPSMETVSFRIRVRSSKVLLMGLSGLGQRGTR